jgi:hypothetical protein
MEGAASGVHMQLRQAAEPAKGWMVAEGEALGVGLKESGGGGGGAGVGG